jgi:hypothetical protein
VILTRSPHNIAAITATIDLEMPVKRKKEIITDKQSVRNGFLNKNLFTTVGKCRKEKTKEI